MVDLVAMPMRLRLKEYLVLRSEDLSNEVEKRAL